MTAKEYLYGAIPAGRGIEVRVRRTVFRRRPRVDIRIWYEFRYGDPDTARPTRRGINLPLRDVPRLRALLQRIEADALAAGDLRLDDYDGGDPSPERISFSGGSHRDRAPPFVRTAP